MSKKTIGNIFSLCVFLFTLTLFITSFQYPFRSRIIPMVVCAVVIFMVIWQFLVDNVKSFQRYAKSGEIELFADAKKDAKEAKKAHLAYEDTDKAAQAKRVRVSMAWLAGYLAGMILVGIEVASPIFLFLFLLRNAKVRLRWSLISTVVACGVIYYVFVMVLNLNLYKGLLLGPLLN